MSKRTPPLPKSFLDFLDSEEERMTDELWDLLVRGCCGDLTPADAKKFLSNRIGQSRKRTHDFLKKEALKDAIAKAGGSV